MSLQKRKITQEMINQVKLLKDQKLSVKKIQKEINKNFEGIVYGKEFVYRVFEKLEIKKNKKSTTDVNNINCYDQELLRQTKILFEQRYTQIKIAEKLNTTLHIVRNCLAIQKLTTTTNDRKILDSLKDFLPEHIEFGKKLFVDEKLSKHEVYKIFKNTYPDLKFGFKKISEIYEKVMLNQDRHIKNVNDIECYDEFLLNQINKLFLEGKSRREMMKELNIPISRVKQYLKIQNLSLKERDKSEFNKETLKIFNKLKHNVSGAVRTTLKSIGKKKNGKTFEKLGYSVEELKLHIESQFEPWMRWDNWGKYNKVTHHILPTWELDHKIPQSDLIYDSFEHPNFRKCWELKNLRPLDAKINNYDGVNRIRHKEKLINGTEVGQI